MANFFKSALNFIKKPLAAVASIAGNLIVPGLGTAVSGIIDPPKVQEMATKAVESGTINESKIVQTLVASGINPTPAKVQAVVQDIQKVAIDDPAHPQITASNPLPTDGTIVPMSTKIMSYIKTHWVVIAGGAVVVVGVIYFFSHRSHGHRR